MSTLLVHLGSTSVDVNALTNNALKVPRRIFHLLGALLKLCNYCSRLLYRKCPRYIPSQTNFNDDDDDIFVCSVISSGLLPPQAQSVCVCVRGWKQGRPVKIRSKPTFRSGPDCGSAAHPILAPEMYPNRRTLTHTNANEIEGVGVCQRE